MEQILKSISSFLWGAPVLILLAAVGLLFGCKTKFFQFRKFGYILKNTAGEMFKKGGGAKGKEGTLTPLQAVSSALAGCEERRTSQAWPPPWWWAAPAPCSGCGSSPCWEC